MRTWVSISPAVTLGPVMQEDFKLIIISTKHFTTKSLLSALSCGVKRLVFSGSTGFEKASSFKGTLKELELTSVYFEPIMIGIFWGVKLVGRRIFV